MNVRETLRRINFKIGTLDDISGRAINPIIPNRNIIDELNMQMVNYANITKGIQDIYSFPLETNTPFIEAPVLSLKGSSYFYAYIVSRGTIFPMDFRAQRDVFPVFNTSPIQGISNWMMPWEAGKKSYLTLFPMNSITRQSSVLTNPIAKDDTTIPVAASSGFISTNGRLTIGSEKILYSYKDSTNFYGCVRGVEMTTAVKHDTNSDVLENNVMLFYARLPIKIEVFDDNIIEKATLDHEIEIVEEHLNGIIDAIAYSLLIKIDPERAKVYKVDADALYSQYKLDVKKGSAANKNGTNFRMPYPINEGGIPYGANFVGY
uniref:Putative baseplate protein n=1 Tax=viral metagenome TaxID=1070528 RepID=A0A6M3IY67_9ZZZZ